MFHNLFHYCLETINPTNNTCCMRRPRNKQHPLCPCRRTVTAITVNRSTRISISNAHSTQGRVLYTISVHVSRQNPSQQILNTQTFRFSVILTPAYLNRLIQPTSLTEIPHCRRNPIAKPATFHVLPYVWVVLTLFLFPQYRPTCPFCPSLALQYTTLKTSLQYLKRDCRVGLRSTVCTAKHTCVLRVVKFPLLHALLHRP